MKEKDIQSRCQLCRRHENDDSIVTAAAGAVLHVPEVPQAARLHSGIERGDRPRSSGRLSRGYWMSSGDHWRSRPVELDGSIIILRLHERFWHQRTMVLSRVGAYLIGRIPDIIIVVVVADVWELDEANDAPMY
ncbi:hypothetical protein ACHAXS_006739 [Conticribra weissflogii]